MSSFFKQTDLSESDKKYRPWYSLKAGQENVYRLAPSCRNLPKNDYASFHSIHWGYSVFADNNPDRLIAKPFECVKKIDYKTKAVTVVCAEDDKIEQAKRELAELQERLKAEGHGKDVIESSTRPLSDWLRAHNEDRKWYCYAKNLAGEWNILKIGHKVKLKTDALITRLKKEDKIDALDPSSGVWIRFTPNGLKGSAADTSVEVYREKTEIGGQRVEVMKAGPLSEEDEKAIAQLPDVTNCVAKLTPEQVRTLVESGGDPAVATSIFEAAKQLKPVDPQPQQAAQSAPKPVETKVVMAPAPQPQVAAPTPVASVAKAAPTDVGAMSADEFLRKFQKTPAVK